MTAQELEKAIRNGEHPAVCYLYGEEQFLVERAAKALLDRVIDPGLKDFNFNCFFGTETKGTEIVDAAQTMPMFAERRAVLVKRADALKAEPLEALLAYVQNPSPTTCLIFTGTKIDQRKKFFQELKKQGSLVEFKRLYENKVGGFIQEEGVSQGKKIDPQAADLLAYLIGNNLQELSSQIEKLVIFAGQKPRITVEDVRTMASDSKAFTVFELARFLCEKDLQKALKSLEALFLNGEEVPMMIGALSRHFRQLWKVRELMDRKVGQQDMAKEAGVNPFFLRDMMQQAKAFDRSRLRWVFQELYRCDIASKTGGDGGTLMHELVYGICRG